MSVDVNELNLLSNQIRHIVLGKPITDDMRCKRPEFQEVQEAMDYLIDCIKEAGELLINVSVGNLDLKPPVKHNYITGNLKELHAGLRHLTWQANQVAHGDYNQKVMFLGDFSNSFNQMVNQLAEREDILKKQSRMLGNSLELFKLIFNGIRDWIVVVDHNNTELLFLNDSANKIFDGKAPTPKENIANLFDYVKNYKSSTNSVYTCYEEENTYCVKSFTVEWNDRDAVVHHIIDITEQHLNELRMINIAYKDALTGLYNRRYSIDRLENFIDKNIPINYCLIDLDGLKFANDNFGHTAGDEYLQTVATVLEKAFFDKAIVARLGGDEFVVISETLKETEFLDIIAKAEQKVISKSKNYPMSFSYGVIKYDGLCGQNITAKEIMDLADEKMYVYKRARKMERTV